MPRIQVSYLQDLLSLPAGHTREFFLDLTAHHVRNNLIQRRILEIHGCDELPVPHNRNPVYDVGQLLQPVRYVDDAAAFRLQIPDNSEQILDLPGCQGRCGLIHNQDSRMGRQSLRNLHHLLL